MLDRGFIFGDGVYEVVPVYSRVPFRLDEHLARLRAQPRRDRHPQSRTRARNGAASSTSSSTRQPFEDQGVYFQVTRGVAKRDHAFPKDAEPTVFMMTNPLVTPPREQVENGAAAVTAHDNRWLRCDIKSISLIGNVPAAPALGRGGRGGDDPVPRRQAHRSLGVERVRREARRDPVAAQERT